MKTHLFGTWLLANLFHPVIFAIVFVIQGGGGFEITDLENIGPFFYFVIILSLLSVPSLIICLPVGEWMNKTKLSAEFVFGTWLLLSPVIVVLNFILILLFTPGRIILPDLFLFALPGMAAVVLASLLRYKSFFKIMSQIKNTNNETTLV